MRLSGITYQGPQERDDELLARLPRPLRSLLSQVNGFILMGGALHVRGACDLPSWHSLEEAWSGESPLSISYAAVAPEDVPFAEDALGDQFLLCDGLVNKLHAETGVSFKAVPAEQRLAFLADFSAKVSKLPEGARISIQVVR